MQRGADATPAAQAESVEEFLAVKALQLRPTSFHPRHLAGRPAEAQTVSKVSKQLAGDGFEEATVDYGLSALRGLAKGLVDQPLEVLAQEILRDVQRFCAPEAPHDDCTLMALRLQG